MDHCTSANTNFEQGECGLIGQNTGLTLEMRVSDSPLACLGGGLEYKFWIVLLELNMVETT